jgi:hypothetical protein
MSNRQLSAFGWGLGIVTGLFLLALFQPSVDHDAEAAKQHCLMVQLWNETQGEFGWPDYNNTAHTCNNDNLTIVR